MNVYARRRTRRYLKLESSVGGDPIETSAVTTGAGWQTIRLDFSDQVDTAVVYDKLSVFPSFGDAGTGQTYYFDDVKFLDAVPEYVIPTVNVSLTMAGFAFAVDGEANGDLYLEPGYAYVLDTSALDAAGQESNFKLSTTPDGTHGGGAVYTDTSVVVEDLANNTITIYPTEETPTLYYFNPFMGGLGGEMPIGPAPTMISVTAAGGKYYMDGVEQGFVDLAPGTTYVFDVSDELDGFSPAGVLDDRGRYAWWRRRVRGR